MYGEKQYGIIEYAAETESGEEEIYEDLTKIVPPVVTRLKEMYELYHSEGYEIGQLYQAFFIYDDASGLPLNLGCFLLFASIMQSPVSSQFPSVHP